jgi:uncharacterized protein
MKKLIIDGHNLIPKMPGLHLKDADDEVRLIEIIQEYCRLARRQAELFFDVAPDPVSNNRKNGLVRVHFIKIGYSADDAMIQYLRNHQKENENYLVVSSDHRIQNEALSIGCKTINSEAFARSITELFSSDTAVRERKEKPLSEPEVAEWMRLFESNDPDQRK